ncbi:hypothetical protein L873DRAFT_434304 [Choiromyces venosus 120613-1]|uniref:Uncharacterized protein n=1 Tax=Choiromyces venosus 120613-1 TaxID=1336337 RepID=A0A3N4IZQ6_9PEZI|nr:hypothetical protein L873DRAFT_434304 [Choiromyces venosus 120613-1]
MEFSLPYMPAASVFPRNFQPQTVPAVAGKNKHRYPTRQRSAPLRIKLGEVIPKFEPRRKKRRWTVKEKRVTQVVKPVVTLRASSPPAPAPPPPASPFPPPAPAPINPQEQPQAYKPPQYPNTYSSHQVFVTRLANQSPATLPGSTLVKLIYVSDAQTLDSFLQKLRQKWELAEVKGVRVEVEGQVFDVDLGEERDWEVVLGVVGGIAGVVVWV